MKKNNIKNNEKGMLKGKFRIENINTGENREVPNTIMNVGFSSVTSMMISGVASAGAFGYISIGEGSSTVTQTDTTLGDEYLTTQTSNSQTTTTATNDTASLSGIFIIDAIKTINEAGIFNVSGLDTGSMLARTTFNAISAISGDSINATWDITLS